jgi:hypothetical protein
MSTGGRFPGGQSTTDGGEFVVPPNGAGAQLYRIRPNHGVVFIELEFSCEKLGQTQTWLLEETVEDDFGERPVLVPLERDAIADGVAWHPVTFLPLAPEETLWLSGYDGIQPFLGTWIPLPFLRLVTDRTRSTYLDNGPSNWVRMFLVPPDGDLRDARSLKAVLAIDTRLTDTSRLESPRYLGPTIEDATFGSTFALASESEDLSDFLSETWVDEWLRTAFEKGGGHNGRGVAGDEAGKTFELEHVARYLALLATLKDLSPIPQLRFSTAANHSASSNRNGLELAVDVSGNDINAFLVGKKPVDREARRRVTKPLAVRELSRPDKVHTDAVPAYVEFDQPAFGDARLSRLSGRTDACSWPSMVRIGEEAKRLGLRANATDGVTGSSDFIRYPCDASHSAKVWRLSTDCAAGERAGPMATSAALDHLTEDGRLVGGEVGGLPAVRPKFSKSSLICLFIGELVLHAVAQAAEPYRHDANLEAVQHADIDTIKLALPVSIGVEEQRAILNRARDGIDLIWRLQGWDQDHTGTAPHKPNLHASVGADLAVQLLYLEDEVDTRFGGDFRSFAAAAGRLQSTSRGMDAKLRVASLELGPFAFTLVVSEYDVDELGGIHPSLSRAERTPPGMRAVTRAILERHILPEIERALERSQLPSAASFLREISGRAPVVWQMDDGDYSVRLEKKVLEPAAHALLELYGQLPATTAHGIEHISFATLIELGGGEPCPLTQHFDAAAIRAGARHFDLASVRIPLNTRAIREILRSELDVSLSNSVLSLEADNCDIVLLAGPFAHLSDVRDVLLKHVAVSPHRLVVMPADKVASAKRGGDRDHTRLLGVLGIFDEHRLPAAGDFSYQGDLLPDTTRDGDRNRFRPRALPAHTLTHDQAGPDVEHDPAAAFSDIRDSNPSSEQVP